MHGQDGPSHNEDRYQLRAASASQPRSATTLAVGSSSCSNSSRFGATSTYLLVTPVRLPPGRLRLATRPVRIGSIPPSKTIGMVVVTAFAATAAGLLVATITATFRRTKSASNPGKRSL